MVNTRILGTIIHPKQWKVLVNDAGDMVNKVLLSHKKAHLFVDNVDELIDHRFSNPMKSGRKSGSVWYKIIGKQ